jgi:hypothetical protein
MSGLQQRAHTKPEPVTDAALFLLLAPHWAEMNSLNHFGPIIVCLTKGAVVIPALWE